MIDYSSLAKCWQSLALGHWATDIEALSRSRLSSATHGDFERWRGIIASLEDARSDPAILEEALLGLCPWRKGPFELGGVSIDAEWRSDLKWDRVSQSIAALEGRNVLDVGCGNGYYALRMREAGAQSVIGIDPTLLFVMQFLAINHFAKDDSVFVLPLRLHELPGPARAFDTTFSMGVLYHQRSPIDHLRELKNTLRSNGQLVLETLYLPGEDAFARTPTDRYARMKNVWLLPTIAELTTWLQRSGFRDIEVIDECITATAEQRSTKWMSFDSLDKALAPDDPTMTIEGWPAPQRVVITASVR
ncbi:MAG: tRNA 5-methoxyuridine(34)/uridine 5-oxyacetic acid(34) synthase CmoB [Proteobacteria bacterium]|nr:tRNA 5-methoxyuridine(34)/uridine 5-oxyacetic acid(34) synthase CmoB [Pseudomonadota bacterium]